NAFLADFNEVLDQYDEIRKESVRKERFTHLSAILHDLPDRMNDDSTESDDREEMSKHFLTNAFLADFIVLVQHFVDVNLDVPLERWHLLKHQSLNEGVRALVRFFEDLAFLVVRN